ncbi:MAG: hypothetical protein ACKOFW_22145 [Planctomycetaceae bacterium]
MKSFKSIGMPLFSQSCRIQRIWNVIAQGVLLACVTLAHADSGLSAGEREIPLIGYTEGRNDLEGGQFVNWKTNRACVVRVDGTGRRVLAENLTRKENTWTQFAGWSPDGQQAVILSLWEDPGNAAWEREHKTFRMTEGWLVDTCLLDLATGTINNLTAVDRVSIYNTGLFFRPDGAGYGFTPLMDGVSKPFVMDLDGRNKRDVSGSGGGFAYGYSASPDGTRISYHENYQIHVSNADGSEKRKVETGNPFNFVPQWSPDGQWLLFVSGEHYNCHPHIVSKDGTGLRKLADRGGYRGVVERLKHPDFHSESSDVPAWAADGRSVYYTAKVGESIELMRVSLDGTVEQLTKSQPRVRHYHPSASPDGRWILFGSDRGGSMQLYVARADGSDARAVTNVPADSCAMHGHWQPVGGDRHSSNPRNAQDDLKQAADDLVAITPRVVERQGVLGVEYHSGQRLVGRSVDAAPAGVQLRLPDAKAAPVDFRMRREVDGGVELGPVTLGELTFRLRITQRNPALIERTLEVTAAAEQRFALTFPLELAIDGEFAAFSGPVAERTVYDTGVRERRNQTFPVAMLRTADRVYGVVADSPGYWDNRCQVSLDPAGKQLAVLAGDGGDPFPMIIKPPEDARDTYQYDMDGWQRLSAGQTRRFTTWVFASPARTHYDAQVAFHLAVANARGWNSSALEAVLRNTSLYLLRRNLMRDENNVPRDGKYIFISGMTYGWKQWVSTGIYSALGLNDPEAMIEAYRAVFWHRMDYEENAQYYLIWAALAQRAGGAVNRELVTKAYEFIRRHERDGFYIPPPLPGAPHPKGWKTYMDVLHYDDDDCPASNQGFHCGALMAAKELGLPIADEDIDAAIAAYQRIFNQKLGFMPTSLKQRDVLGQDTLYGATLTYAVFGRKVLTDEQVLTHYRTSEKVKSPFGLRVISAADGSLLPGHGGAYCFGGSWFFCDSGNYLLAGAHGLAPEEVDARLIERIKLELVRHPAFNEDINTVSGQPHGNAPYADYSVYIWLRQQIRRALNQSGPDPVGQAIDAQWRVVRENDMLRLNP